MSIQQTIGWFGLPVLVVALGLPARADFTQSRATQIQLTVDGASGTANASNTAGFAVAGSGITVTGPLNTGVNLNPQARFQAPTDGEAFTFSMSTFTADQITETYVGSNTDVILPAYSEISVTVGGSTEGLSGNISSSGQATITPGGPGTTAVLTQTRSFSVFDRSSSPVP